MEQADAGLKLQEKPDDGMIRKMNILAVAVLAAVFVVCGVGCEKVTWDTTYTINTLVEETKVVVPGDDENDPVTEVVESPYAGNMKSYLFYVRKGEVWKAASYEDAVAGRIVQVEKDEQGAPVLAVNESPDMTGERRAGEAVIEFKKISKGNFVIVVCDTDNNIYAYKKGATSANLPQVWAKILIKPESGADKYTDSRYGWTMVNKDPEPEPDPDEGDGDGGETP